MGEAKRRAVTGTPSGFAPNPTETPSTIRVRGCLMSAAQRCRLQFRVVASEPAAFMCHDHWRHVPEPTRRAIRIAAERLETARRSFVVGAPRAADERDAKIAAARESWQLAARTAVWDVLHALTDVDNTTSALGPTV